MKRQVTAVLGAVAMVVMANAAAAQAKPDFSGKWVLDAEKTAAANPQAAGGGGGGGGRGGRGGGPAEMTLKVDGTALTQESMGRGGQPQSTAYKLDGAEGTITMGQGEAKYKAKWEGNTIVIDRTQTMGDATVTSKIVYSMEGEYLVVATTGAGRGGGEPVTTKRYYKKAA